MIVAVVVSVAKRPGPAVAEAVGLGVGIGCGRGSGGGSLLRLGDPWLAIFRIHSMLLHLETAEDVLDNSCTWPKGHRRTSS